MDTRPTFAEARALLGVASGADARTLRRAWAAALRAARPDRGGDEALYRRIVAAYRLLQAAPADRVAFPPTIRNGAATAAVTELRISAAQAVAGGWRLVQVDDGPTYRVRIPPGAADGLSLRLRGRSPGGGDLLIVLRTPRAASRVADALRRRFSQAWAA